MQQVEFFVDALSDYQCDAALFPEFFNAPLMGLVEDLSPVESVRTLATHSPAIIEAISKMAVSYNINIVAGSMPVLVDGKIRNAAYLCRRDGTLDVQYKIHPTPHEARAWAMEGGDKLHVFDTDFGKIGVLICYDVEFPELARIQSDEGMQILFVPFWTDTKNGYLRVRLCAHARAVENECYVAIAGSVGNLPKVDGADIQYAQSAVFSPSDFAFPHDAILAETTPNTEMTIIVDLDFEKLHRLKHEGSVRNSLRPQARPLLAGLDRTGQGRNVRPAAHARSDSSGRVDLETANGCFGPTQTCQLLESWQVSRVSAITTRQCVRTKARLAPTLLRSCRLAPRPRLARLHLSATRTNCSSRSPSHLS